MTEEGFNVGDIVYSIRPTYILEVSRKVVWCKIRKKRMIVCGDQTSYEYIADCISDEGSMSYELWCEMDGFFKTTEEAIEAHRNFWIEAIEKEKQEAISAAELDARCKTNVLLNGIKNLKEKK